VGQSPAETLSAGTERQQLSGPVALIAVILLVVVTLASIQFTGPLWLLLIGLLTVIGLKSRPPLGRQLGAVGYSALVWLALWAVAEVVGFYVPLSGGELYPALVPAVLGPIAGALVLRRLWLRAVREERPRPWRVPTWLMLGWTALLVVGVVNVDASFGEGGSAATAQGLAFAALAAIWFVGFIVLSIVWLLTRLLNDADRAGAADVEA
jgi:hypothetical protein